MKNKFLPGLLAGAVVALPVWAFEPFVVKDIRVEGIQRTEAGTVFNYLPVKVGETFTDEKSTQALRALFATGFFKDVRIDVDKGVIVVVVEERPAIASIDFIGMSEFDKETLKKALDDLGLGESKIFERAILEKAEQELKRQYLSKGYYDAQFVTTVTPLERNRVGINFAVAENSIAKIRQIHIVGNKIFSEPELLDLFQLRTPGVWTWYTKNDQYSRQKLSADLENLRTFYLNRGYLDFSIETNQVSISADKKDIFITIGVNEGAQYKLSSVKLTGDLTVPENELRALVKVAPGEIFSREKITETTKLITDRLGNDGYAFANVNAVPEVDKDKKEVAFTIFVDPGKRAYVRRVNIGGNTKTRDEVIRREVRQMEGAWYDAALLNRSKKRVDRLGFFDDVSIETKPVPETHDQVDINMGVKERSTGSFSLGAGFSSAEKVALSASVSQQNIFGSGNALGLNVNTSKSKRTYSLSFTDPYFTKDGVSLGWDVYHRTLDTESLDSVQPYKTVSDGLGVRLGYPISEDDSVKFGAILDKTKVTVFKDSPPQYFQFVDVFGESVTSFSLNAAWARDKRDSFTYPREGTYQQISAEAAVPPLDLRYGKLGYQFQYWLPVFKRDAVMFNVDLGYAHGYGGKEMPFYKNFYAGGIGSVRGYAQSSLGPKYKGDSVGGNRKLVMNTEYYFPMPGTGLDKSFRISLFFDAGQVWGQSDKFDLGDLRYSTGAGFSWNSPFGPLKFSVGFPLNKKDEDEAERFQFQVGTVF